MCGRNGKALEERGKERRGANITHSAGAPALFPEALRYRRLSPQLGRASCGFGAQVDSKSYLNLNELFSPWVCGKPEKDFSLTVREGCLVQGLASVVPHTASASVVLIQASQLGVSQVTVGYAVVIRIECGELVCSLDRYFIGLQKKSTLGPWLCDVVSYASTSNSCKHERLVNYYS